MTTITKCTLTHPLAGVCTVWTRAARHRPLLLTVSTADVTKGQKVRVFRERHSASVSLERPTLSQHAFGSRLDVTFTFSLRFLQLLSGSGLTATHSRGPERWSCSEHTGKRLPLHPSNLLGVTLIAPLAPPQSDGPWSPLSTWRVPCRPLR